MALIRPRFLSVGRMGGLASCLCWDRARVVGSSGKWTLASLSAAEWPGEWAQGSIHARPVSSLLVQLFRLPSAQKARMTLDIDIECGSTFNHQCTLEGKNAIISSLPAQI